MSMLKPTDIYGTVAFIGVNRDRNAGLESLSVGRVSAGFAGFEADSHGGLTRPSCVRVRRQYKEGTEIRNTRQVTVLSGEELADIATSMGLPGPIRPEWVGANLVLEGIPSLTMMPPASRLIFENGAAIGVDMENGPCKYPAEIIEQHHPGLGLSFPRHAQHKRGVTGWIDREGEIALGDICRLHIPPQRLYEPALRTRDAKIA